MIEIQTSLQNTDLPIVGKYGDIIATSAPAAWWQVGTEFLTQESSLASAIAPKIGSVPIIQPTGTRQPSVVASTFGIYPGLDFDGVDDLMYSAIPYTKTGAFSWVWAGRVAERAEPQCVMSLFGTVAQGVQIMVQPTRRVAMWCGNGFAESAANLFDWGDALFIVLASDQSTARLYLNGALVASVAHDNNITAGELRWGGAQSGLQAADHRLAECLIYPRSLHADLGLIRTLAARAREYYGAGA